MKDGSEDVRPSIFLDRDGVLNENRSDYVKSWEEIVFLRRVFEALRALLARRNWLTLVVTNQSAINRKLVSQSTIDQIHRRRLDIIKHQGGRIEAVLYCPHRPNDNCDCRKPRLGLLLQAAEQFGIDLSQSYIVGDASSDIVAGLQVGCRPILVLTGSGPEELVRLRTEGYDGYRVAAHLWEAVDLILTENEGENH